jgi:RNA polymerase sigma-70 factor (ECF subfamily)
MAPSARQYAPLPAADNVRDLPRDAVPDDATLVAGAQQGDRWAEEALYRRHVGYVAGMVSRLLGGASEAEDVVQDTFALGLDRLATLRDPSAVRAWLAQIAVSQVRRRLRRTKLLTRLGLHPSLDHLQLESLAVEEADAETRAELTRLGTALAKLPTDDRLVWMLRHVQGEPLKEIARLCACSLATVKRRLIAASNELQKHVDSPEVLP